MSTIRFHADELTVGDIVRLDIGYTVVTEVDHANEPGFVWVRFDVVPSHSTAPWTSAERRLGVVETVELVHPADAALDVHTDLAGAILHPSAQARIAQARRELPEMTR